MFANGKRNSHQHSHGKVSNGTRAMYVSPRVFYFLHSGRMFCAITHAEDIWLR